MRILLDAGHGGSDPGATVRLLDGRELRECDLTLETTIRVKEKLCPRFPKVDVLLSRREDAYMSPGARARLIEALDVSAAVSFHCNAAASTKATGFEVIYRDDIDSALGLAIIMELAGRLPQMRNRGMKQDVEDLGRRLALLNTPSIPVVIVESGFLTNEHDRDVLLDFEMLSSILADGVARWIHEQ